MLSVVLARLETSELLSFILKFEKVRRPSIRYLYWQNVPLRPSRAAGEGGERDDRCKFDQFSLDEKIILLNTTCRVCSGADKSRYCRTFKEMNFLFAHCSSSPIWPAIQSGAAKRLSDA